MPIWRQLLLSLSKQTQTDSYSWEGTYLMHIYILQVQDNHLTPRYGAQVYTGFYVDSRVSDVNKQ